MQKLDKKTINKILINKKLVLNILYFKFKKMISICCLFVNLILKSEFKYQKKLGKRYNL